MATLSTDGTKILNNYDRFTGIPFNATLHPTLPAGISVDNCIWFTNKAENGGGYAKRDYDGLIHASWFGVVGDYNPAGNTGTDNTDSIQDLMQAAIANKASGVYFDEGLYGTKYVNMYNFSIIGSGYKTVFYPLDSDEINFFRVAEDGPIQRVVYQGFSIFGNATLNPNQSGFTFVAKPQLTGGHTGGIWYSSFNDIEVKGFPVNNWYFECLDNTSGPLTGDMANQFLNFNNCKGYSPASLTSRSLKVVGQFGQVLFNGGEFSSNYTGVQTAIPKGATCVEFIARPDNSDSDNIYTVLFNGTTFQNSDIGISFKNCYSNITLFNCHWENMARSVIATSSSIIDVINPVFGQAGNGARIGEAGNGSGVVVSNSGVRVSNPTYSGVMDNGVDHAGGSIGIEINTMLKTFSIKNPTYQIVSTAGVIDIQANKEVLLNNNTVAVATINHKFSHNQEFFIKLNSSGGVVSQAFTSIGNLTLPSTTVIFRTGQFVRFRVSGTKLVLINFLEAYKIIGSGDPEGSVFAGLNTEFIRTDLPRRYIKATGDNTNTGWDQLELGSNVRLKVTKSITTLQQAISADGSLNCGAFNSVLVNNSNTLSIISIVSQLTVGDEIDLIINGTGQQSGGLNTDYVKIDGGLAGTANSILLGGFGINGSIVLRQGDVCRIKKVTLPFSQTPTPLSGWIVVSAPNRRYSSAIPTTGIWFRDEVIYKKQPVSGDNEGWIVTTPGSIGTAVFTPFGKIGVI